jgi:tetratricopeptide (TPR) repeat protein
MNALIKIALFLLFIALHLDVGRWFVEMHAVFYASFAALVSLVVFFPKSKSKLRVHHAGVTLAIALCLFLLLQLLLQGNLYGVHRAYATLMCWLLFFVLGIFFSADRHTMKWCFFAAAASVAIEVVLGFAQLFGWMPNSDDYFRLGGTFGNPGAYAGYLAVVAPMILSVFLVYRRSRKSENLFYFLAGCFVFSIFMLVISRSRGAWLACGLGCLIVLNDRFSLLRKAADALRTPARKAVAVAALLTAGTLGAYALYQFKADSALGRMLVWKISAAAPHSGWLWGNGTGYFEAGYGKWQATYFAEHGGTERERYLADYVTCAYNEFFETALEQGVVFLLIFAGLLAVALRQKRSANSALRSGAKASVAAIVALMCVSYPLKITPIYLYLVFCIAVLLVNTRKGIAIGAIPVKLILLGVGAGVAAAGFFNLYGYGQLKQGQKHVFFGQTEKGIAAYQSALPALKNSGFFRFCYGSALAQAERYGECIEELKASIQKSSNPSSYILLGNSCQKLSRWKEAEEAYKVAAYMMPNKLYPKYLLAKLYVNIEEYGEAEKWAQEILCSKEKVPTTAAKEIKEEMKTLIQDCRRRAAASPLPSIWQLGKNDFESLAALLPLR